MPLNSGGLTDRTKIASQNNDVEDTIFSSIGTTNIGKNAINNGERLVNTDTNKNHPINGYSHRGIATAMINVAAQLSNNGAALHRRCPASPP